MQPLLAITGLTVRAAFRFRLAQVLAVGLIAAVVLLPLMIKDDGTARGLTQILLTYTLTLITALLGLATLWLACGTLARDIEECQMQMVVVKPIARWQVWLGKWLGIMAVNAMLLALSGGAVYFLLQWRAGKLLPQQQEILRNEVLVARNSLKEGIPDLEPVVRQAFEQRLKEATVSAADRPLVLQQIREQAKAQLQLVPPGYARVWEIELGWRRQFLRDLPLFLRVKFATAKPRESTLQPPPSFLTLWQVGVPGETEVARNQVTLASETFHEIPVPANLFDQNGRLTIEFSNPNDETLLFQVEDGLEVLYREGGFGLNFVRGVLILACWLGLLAAIGLAASSFLSFPVASFFAFALLLVAFSTSTLNQVVEEGGIVGVDPNTGVVGTTPGLLNKVAVPLFKGLLSVINLARGFSPIDLLSSGRSISWGQLGLAITQVVLLMGGLFAALGMILFTRRELATAQGNQ
jgi:hypothetical protein